MNMYKSTQAGWWSSGDHAKTNEVLEKMTDYLREIAGNLTKAKESTDNPDTHRHIKSAEDTVERAMEHEEDKMGRDAQLKQQEQKIRDIIKHKEELLVRAEKDALAETQEAREENKKSKMPQNNNNDDSKDAKPQETNEEDITATQDNCYLVRL